MCKKNIYLFVIGILTIICISVGIIRSTKKATKNFSWKKAFHLEWDFDDDCDWNFDEESSGKNDYSKPVDEFSEIEIDAQILGIEIVHDDKFWVQAVYNKEDLEPLLRNQNGKLYVYQNVSKGPHTGNRSASMRISVPYDVDLSNIYVNVNVGEVRIKEMNADKIKISTNVGEVNVSNSSFTKLTAETNVGEIKVRSAADSDFSDYKIKAETDVGELDIFGKSYKHSYNQSGTENKSIDLETNVGKISIN